MRLVTMIAASVLSTSLALGVASDAGQKTTPKPNGQPQIEMLPEARVPSMTHMPNSRLEAAFLLNQNGQNIVVDTAGKPLAPSHHDKSPKPIAPGIYVTGNARS